MSSLVVPLISPLLLALLPAGQGGSRDDEGRIQMVRLIEAPDLIGDELRARLAAIRPTPLESLFEVLATGTIPADWREGQERPLRLHDAERSAVRSVVAAVPPARLRSFFGTVATEEARLECREAAMAILAEVGARRDLELVMSLATPLDPELDVLPRSLRKTFEDAVGRILSREGDGLSTLRGAFGRAHPGLRSAIVDAIGESPSREALSTLVSFLGQAHELDPYVLAAIARMGTEVRHPVAEDLMRKVRGLLKDSDLHVANAAARACGSLEDFDAVQPLIELLEHEDAGMRTSAHRALQDLTGVGFRPDVRLWRGWYARELDWWEVDAPGAFRDLDSPNELRAAEAMAQISRHHLRRHELAAALVPCLRRKEPGLVRMACDGLAQLGSPVAGPELVACLEHPDWSVRRAAWSALCRITGLDLPPEPEYWLPEVGL